MADQTIQSISAESRDNMKKAVQHAQDDFSAIRTGRAVPALVEHLHIELYGSMMPLQQLASISVPEARQLVISPYDKSAIKAIEKAIQDSDLGVNPSNDGVVIRINFPQLTEERRKELVKVVKAKAEDARVALRNQRRHARQAVEALEKKGEISKDDLESAEKDLDKLTSEFVAEIDRMLETKEKELMEV